MKTQTLFKIINIVVIVVFSLTTFTQTLHEVKHFEELLDPVMEIIDTNYLKQILVKTEVEFKNDPSLINKAKLGIVYHEVTLNFAFLSTSMEYKGFSKKSYDILTEIMNDKNTTENIKPFISAYQASALSLRSAEEKDLKLLKEAFVLFDKSVEKYGDVSYAPRFMRGSVAENLPWIFFKRKIAIEDMTFIINKYEENNQFANNKIMSFSYWAWANQHKSHKYRKQGIKYLNTAIELDPDGIYGKSRAEKLLLELSN